MHNVHFISNFLTSCDNQPYYNLLYFVWCYCTSTLSTCTKHCSATKENSKTVKRLNADNPLQILQPCTTPHINAVLPMVSTTHNVLIMCFPLLLIPRFLLSFHWFSISTSPQRKIRKNSVLLLMWAWKPGNTRVHSEALLLVTTWRCVTAVLGVGGVKVKQGEEEIARNSPGCWTVRWVCAPTSSDDALAPSAPALSCSGPSPASSASQV